MSKNLLPGLTNLRVHWQAPPGGGFIIPLVGDPVPMAHKVWFVYLREWLQIMVQ